MTGAFISARDIGYQNILDVDPRNGKVTYRPDRIPRLNVPMDMCPSTSGFKSWRAMAYSPQTNAMYIPLNLNCEKAVFGAPAEPVVGRPAGNPVRRTNLVHPESNGYLGEFRGMDVRSGKATWQVRTASPMNTAALTTAGGLVFGGDWDRNFYAYDARTGKVLWKTRLPTSAQGYPISVCRERQTVCRGASGYRRCELVDPDCPRTASRYPPTCGRQLAAGVCAAGVTGGVQRQRLTAFNLTAAITNVWGTESGR